MVAWSVALLLSKIRIWPWINTGYIHLILFALRKAREYFLVHEDRFFRVVYSPEICGSPKSVGFMKIELSLICYYILNSCDEK